MVYLSHLNICALKNCSYSSDNITSIISIYFICFISLKMALSAGTPIIRGYLVDTDCRWSVISAAVDDRTPEERGLEASKKKQRTVIYFDTLPNYSKVLP